MANSDEHKIHKQKKLNFLYVSIVAHILLGLLAAYIIIQVITPRPKPKFTAAPPSQMAVHPDEHKVKQEKRNNTMSAPAIKRIAANVASNITLPPMPDVPTLNTTMGAGNSIGAGLGIGVGTGAGPGGGGPHVFGLRGGVGLKGTFYDFKQTKDGRPTDMENVNVKSQQEFARIMVQFSKTFDETPFQKYYKAPDPLYSPFVFYPAIPSEEAPNEFGVGDKVRPALWCTVYKGTVIPPVGGTYYFVGLGDDVCIVRFNSATVLDHGTFSWPNRDTNNKSNEWNPKFFKCYLYSNLVNGSIYSGYYRFMHGHMTGKPITVTAGMSYQVEIIVGDWGGYTQAQVLLEKEGVEYKKDPGGSPILPIFCVSLDGTVKIPNFPETHAPPYDHNPPAWSIWKLGKQSMIFQPM